VPDRDDRGLAVTFLFLVRRMGIVESSFAGVLDPEYADRPALLPDSRPTADRWRYARVGAAIPDAAGAAGRIGRSGGAGPKVWAFRAD
jgi:hypothetical protein